jgi:hypothetical protein
MLSATAEEDPPVVLTATSDRERRNRRSNPSYLPPKNGTNGAVLTVSESSDNETGPEKNDSTAPAESEKVHSMAASGTAEECFMSNVGSAGAGERSKSKGSVDEVHQDAEAILWEDASSPIWCGEDGQ